MIDRGKLYSSATDFFKLDGDSTMKLTKLAAIDVCENATKKNCCISMIEGGFWNEPSFQANLDAIWNCEEQVLDIEEVNKKAVTFINNISESEGVDAFILTLDEE
ncbi:MAG: hypothetical protein ACI9LX_004018 [Paraglaciecola sp.]|jgi:hypothetical protein